MATLDETITGTDTEAQHASDHAVLKAAYVARGSTAGALLDYVEGDAYANPTKHRQIHVTLHTEDAALRGSTVLPTTITASTTGHLNHHSVLAVAHNARQAPVATAPATPAAPSVSAGDGAVTVAWTAPLNGGSAITGYDIQRFVGSTAGPVVSVGSVTSTAITGLTNGTAYTFKVRAKNAIGNSAYSASSAAVTPVAPVVQNILTSQTPTAPNLTDNQGTTLMTQFTSDADGNVTGVRMYRATTAPTSAIGLLYEEATSQLIAQKPFGVLSPGWNTVYFDTPVAITPGTVYRAGYWTDGPYVNTAGLFNSPVVNGHLTGVQGYYAYGDTPSFSMSSFGNGCYFADPIVEYVTSSVPPGGGGTPVGTGPDVAHGRQINASNTGIAGVGLTADQLTSNGARTYSTAGQTITAQKFSGTVQITANNITLSGCLISINGGSNAKGIVVTGSNVRLENCTIVAATGSLYMGVHAAGGTGLTVFGCDISKCENDMTIETSGVTVDSCYIHDVSNASNPGGHRDVIEVYGGSNHVIKKSRLVMNADETAVINCAPWFGSTSVANLYVDDNYIDGGHMHFVIDIQSTGTITYVKVRRNDMGGHTTPGVIGRYAALNNSDNRAITGTDAAQTSNPGSIMWPTSGSDANHWVDCSDLSPDRTGQIVVPA